MHRSVILTSTLQSKVLAPPACGTWIKSLFKVPNFLKHCVDFWEKTLWIDSAIVQRVKGVSLLDHGVLHFYIFTMIDGTVSLHASLLSVWVSDFSCDNCWMQLTRKNAGLETTQKRSCLTTAFITTKDRMLLTSKTHNIQTLHHHHHHCHHHCHHSATDLLSGSYNNLSPSLFSLWVP